MSKNSSPRISVCITTRGKEWLLSRTVHTLVRQDMPRDEWELIVIDDCSDRPISPFLEPLRDAGVNVRDFRLEHKDGWRGITVGMLYAFEQARAPIIMETNSHLLLPPESVRLLCELHYSQNLRRTFCESDDQIENLIAERGKAFPLPLWISLRGFTLTTEATEVMDQVDWRADVGNLWDLPQAMDPWTRLWLPAGPEGKKFYGSHLCCSIGKSTFERIQPWPKEGFKDYGTDDPAYAGARRRHGIIDLNVWPVPTMFAHMAHNNHIEDAMELCPTKLNRRGHTSQTAAFWDPPDQRDAKPTLQEVIDFWERGERTTDWRVRAAWGWENPRPEDYIRRAREFIAAGKTRLEEI